MDAQYVSGIDKIELAPIPAAGGLPAAGDWVALGEIEDGSVSYAVSAPSKTRIRVEDKQGVRLVILGDADPDVLNLGTIDLSQANMKKLFGGRIDAATSTYYMPGDTQLVAMAIRLTTKVINGVKQQFTFANTQATAGFNGNFTRSAVVSARIAADILSFPTTVAGEYVKCTIQDQHADGTPVIAA